jgi:acyl-CoA thioesterase
VANIQATLSQNNEIKTFISCCFASERPSQIEVDTPIYKIDTPYSQAKKLPFISGMTPNFIQHVDLRLSSNNMPFTGSENVPMKGWMQFESPQPQLSDSAILALIDAWPPGVLPMLKQPAPASSVTWNVEFLHPRQTLSADTPLYYECEITQASSGLAHTQARILTSNGETIALSRQVVAVYDKKPS